MPIRMNRALSHAALATTVLSSVAGQAAAQSARSASAPPPTLPAAVATRPAKAAPDMQAVLDALASLGGKPIETLTPAQAREHPSAADAAKVVMKQKGMPTSPDASVKTQDRSYGDNAKQFARIYKPASATAGAPLPVVVYYHGGGWVIADVKTYDAAPRAMAAALGAIVVSVEYRHAPEFKFPAQHEDAAAAYRWTLAHAASWGGDPSRIALAGESAGGNLAVATAIYARDNHLPAPAYVVSVYPIANASKTLPSRMDAANAKPLDAAMLPWFGYYYQASEADAQDPRLNLVAADLHGLPPTTIINAQIDPLRSDGETLAAAMRAVGDRVEQRTYPGVTHEFFGMAKVVGAAQQANDLAVLRLRTAFASSPARH